MSLHCSCVWASLPCLSSRVPKLQKPTVSCVMSVDLSDRIVQLVSRWADFHEILPCEGGRVAKLCQETKHKLLKIGQK